MTQCAASPILQWGYAKPRLLSAYTPWGPVHRTLVYNHPREVTDPTHAVVYPIDDQRRMEWARMQAEHEQVIRSCLDRCLSRPDAPLPDNTPEGYATEHERARGALKALRGRVENWNRSFPPLAGTVKAGVYAWCSSERAAVAALSNAPKDGIDRAVVVRVELLEGAQSWDPAF